VGDAIVIGVSASGRVCFDTAFDLSARFFSEPPRRAFVRSDCNADGQRNIADPVRLLVRLFLGGGAELPCAGACDTNADRRLDLSDAVYTLSYLFGTGSPPAPPFPLCGPGGGDEIGCASFPPCA
jgi:hypothetical protein